MFRPKPEGKNVWAGIEAARALAKIGDIEPDQALNAMVTLFGDRWQLSRVAGEAISVFGSRAEALGLACPTSPATIRGLVSALDDPSLEVRLHALIALGMAGPTASPAGDPIAKLLSSAYAPLRLFAVQTLRKIGSAARPLRSEIARLLKDNEELVAEYTAEALRSISERE